MLSEFEASNSLMLPTAENTGIPEESQSSVLIKWL